MPKRHGRRARKAPLHRIHSCKAACQTRAANWQCKAARTHTPAHTPHTNTQGHTHQAGRRRRQPAGNAFGVRSSQAPPTCIWDWSAACGGKRRLILTHHPRLRTCRQPHRCHPSPASARGGLPPWQALGGAHPQSHLTSPPSAFWALPADFWTPPAKSAPLAPEPQPHCRHGRPNCWYGRQKQGGRRECRAPAPPPHLCLPATLAWREHGAAAMIRSSTWRSRRLKRKPKRLTGLLAHSATPSQAPPGTPHSKTRRLTSGARGTPGYALTKPAKPSTRLLRANGSWHQQAARPCMPTPFSRSVQHCQSVINNQRGRKSRKKEAARAMPGAWLPAWTPPAAAAPPSPPPAHRPPAVCLPAPHHCFPGLPCCSTPPYTCQGWEGGLAGCTSPCTAPYLAARADASMPVVGAGTRALHRGGACTCTCHSPLHTIIYCCRHHIILLDKATGSG